VKPLYVANQVGAAWLNLMVLTLFLAFMWFDPGRTDISVAAVLSEVIAMLILLAVRPPYPLRYEVWPDRLDLVFIGWHWRIDYDSIEVVRHSGTGDWRFWLVSLRTRFFGWRGAETVTVLRDSPVGLFRPNLVIYPENANQFLWEMRTAMYAHQIEKASPNETLQGC
jgi:hypothetical protein